MNKSISLSAAMFLSSAMMTFLPPMLTAQDERIDSGDVSRADIDGGGISPFLFTGESRMFGQLADRQGSFQETPDDYARWEFRPTAALYGVPFTLNVLLSTEQSSVRQKINSVSLDFDYQKLQGILLERAYAKINEIEALKRLEETAGGVERLKDSLGGVADAKLKELERIKEYSDVGKLKEKAITESMSQLDALGIVSSTEKFFMDFPALSIGVTYPSYSTLTLSGVPVTGGNIEWNPGKFYIAAAGGKTQRAILVPGIVNIDSVVNDPAYERMIYAGRIGYGRKSGGHVYLTGLYGTDDQNSLPFDSNGVRATPSENYLLGLEANIPLFDDYFLLQAEAVGSMLTGDVNAPGFSDEDLADVPGGVTEVVEPKISSVIDYALAMKSTIRIPETETRLLGSVRLVGPAFFSLGAPTIRNDQLRYDARLEQKFLRRQILATAFVRRDKDNIVSQKTSTTSTSAWGVGLGLNFARLPYLRLEYAPYEQRYANTADNTDIVNTTSVLSGSAGYHYSIAGLRGTTSLLASSQQSKTYMGLSDYGVTNFSAIQSVDFGFPLTIAGGVTLSQLSAVGDSTDRIVSVDVSGSYTAFDIWYTSAGFSLADQNSGDSNIGFFLNSAVSLWDLGVLDVRAARNVYRNFAVASNDFKEFVFTVGLSTRW